MATIFAQLGIAFAGALVAAALAFFVRAQLDARALRAAELKIAYVHFVRFSQFLALEVAFKSIVKILLPESVRLALGKAGSYEASHEVAAAVAALIKHHTDKPDRPNTSNSSLTIFIATTIESLENSRLTDEQMAKLPKASVVAHLQFQSLVDQLIGSMKLWNQTFTDQDFNWVSAEALHDQWRLMVRLSAASRTARASMLAGGVVTTDEAFEILQTQVRHYEEIMSSYAGDVAKLKLAEKVVAERSNDGQGGATT